MPAGIHTDRFPLDTRIGSHHDLRELQIERGTFSGNSRVGEDFACGPELHE